jgi:hypothetical protein
MKVVPEYENKNTKSMAGHVSKGNKYYFRCYNLWKYGALPEEQRKHNLGST